METVTDFIFLGSKITADGDCRHEIKRCLLPRRKSITNLDSMLKSRYITLPEKFHLVKAMVFPVVMDGCESWTIKKAECWRIDAFEWWCWRRLLRVPWTARRSNQSILKKKKSVLNIHWKDWCWDWSFNTLTHLMWRTWLIEKDPDAGKDWRQEEKGTTEDEMVGWHHWLHGHEFDQALGVGDGCYSPWGCKESYTTARRKWTEPEIGPWFCYSAGLTKSPLRGPALTTWSKIRLSYLISLSQYMLLVSSVIPFTMCSCLVCLLSVSSHRN